jgi:hypothetical protein
VKPIPPTKQAVAKAKSFIDGYSDKGLRQLDGQDCLGLKNLTDVDNEILPDVQMKMRTLAAANTAKWNEIIAKRQKRKVSSNH